MRRGNAANIKPTKEKYEKAKKGLERARKNGKLNEAQFNGLMKGLETRYKGVR